MRTTARRSWALALLITLVAALAPSTAVLAAAKDKVDVLDFATFAPVEGTWAKLARDDDGIRSNVHTIVEAGHAFTFWYVIFNNPAACNDGCGEDDIFVDPETPNFAQIDAAQISVVFAGGGVSNHQGRLQLHGGLAEGAVPSGAAQVVIGQAEHGAFLPGPVTGLVDAATAEVHIVIQDHGLASDDPDLLEQQTTQFMGACNPGCADVQGAIHLP